MHIYDLTEHQVILLDTMWAIDSIEEFGKWYKKLTPSNKETVDVLVELIALGDIDERVQKMDSYPDAKKLLENIMG